MNLNILNVGISCAQTCFNMRSRHGAVVFTKDKILSRGYNRRILRTESFTLSLHAEIDALGKVPCSELRGASILVIRLNKNGHLTNSKPCSACMNAIKLHGIKRVYYSVSGGDIVEMKL